MNHISENTSYYRNVEYPKITEYRRIEYDTTKFLKNYEILLEIALEATFEEKIDFLDKCMISISTGDDNISSKQISIYEKLKSIFIKDCSIDKSTEQESLIEQESKINIFNILYITKIFIEKDDLIVLEYCENLTDTLINSKEFTDEEFKNKFGILVYIDQILEEISNETDKIRVWSLCNYFEKFSRIHSKFSKYYII